MLFDSLNAREAVEVGTALADTFPSSKASDQATREFLTRAVQELQCRKFNMYKRVRFANAFRWRLREKGVGADTAAELTQSLLLAAMTGVPAVSAQPARQVATTTRSADSLFRQAEEAYSQANYPEAVEHYTALLRLRPRHVDALNNLGASLCRLGRYEEAQESFRKAISKQPGYTRAYINLAYLLVARGQFKEAENYLRRGLKFNPTDTSARNGLGLALTPQGRLDDARVEFEKVLRVAPRDAEALYGMATIALAEGRFEEAEDLLKRALLAQPRMPRAWTALSSVRKLTSDDKAWLNQGEEIAASLSDPAEEAGVHFAIGKYFDDVGEYAKAFKSYSRANGLLKSLAAPYERPGRTRFVDDLIQVYTPESVARAQAGGSTSRKPIFVVGMMRSGTSLVEQILASHPGVAGAGELEFWNDIVRKPDNRIMLQVPDERARLKIAEDYLRALTQRCPNAQHVVDKTPANAEYLGLIHAVFPQARVIYMRRDPIDVCLSCYFQPFYTSLNFTLDLSDLAHYYAEHARLVAHWREVLPPGTLLEVPYEELVSDQEHWTRKILDFLGLEWDERCLRFHETQRAVLTASRWQVRQPLYRGSVRRWQNYSKFIGPLRNLKPA